MFIYPGFLSQNGLNQTLIPIREWLLLAGEGRRELGGDGMFLGPRRDGSIVGEGGRVEDFFHASLA